MQNLLEKMLQDIRRGKGYKIEGVMIDIHSLVFQESVKMNCFYCGKYNSNWKCPPRLPSIDFHKMLLEFRNAAFIYVSMCLEEEDYNFIRNFSSVQLHRGLLECERWLYNHNYPMALSFIGGSCKLCKNGCALDKCVNPYQARTPVEALGINVIESAKKYDIKITFPPDKEMKRVGLLVW